MTGHFLCPRKGYGDCGWMNGESIIRSWAAEFDKAPTDARKMILARLIDKITVDRDYNIDIHFYVTPEDFGNLATEAS